MREIHPKTGLQYVSADHKRACASLAIIHELQG